VLRRATRADAPAIQAVLASDPAAWDLLEDAPLRADEAEHLLAELPPGVTEDRKYVYVIDDVCVIDMVEGYPTPETWYLGLILIAPGARNLGLGARLLSIIAERARRGGGTALRLAVVSTNVAARRLYDRLGFQLVARRQRRAREVDVLELALTRAPAGFHVEPDCCTRCGVPEHVAPTLFAFVPDSTGCHLVRQPQTDRELEQMVEVLHAQDLGCIRYRGNAPDVLARIRKRGLDEYIDGEQALGTESEPFSVRRSD
jgi:ribosomal protein S18 acetylase RimI-like enzyme